MDGALPKIDPSQLNTLPSPTALTSGRRPMMPRGALSSWYDKPVPVNVADPDAYRAARGFEAHFAQYMVKKMMGDTKMISGKGFGGEQFNAMFTEVLGDEMAGKGTLGITDLVYRDLMKKRGEEPYRKLTNQELIEEARQKDEQVRPWNNGDDAVRIPVAEGPSPHPLSESDAAAMIEALQTRRQQVEGPAHGPTRLSLREPTPAMRHLVTSAAEKYGVDEELVNAVIRAESAWNPYAVSHAGAQGLMQLMPDTARAMGVSNSFDAAQNIEGGVKYLRKMLDEQGGDVKRALAAYNAGPGAVAKYDGIPPYPETTNYVSKIIGWIKGEDAPSVDESDRDDELEARQAGRRDGSVAGLREAVGLSPADALAGAGLSPELLKVAREHLARTLHPSAGAEPAAESEED